MNFARLIRHGYVSADLVRAWFGTNWSVVGSLVTASALAIALLVPDTMEIAGYREGDAKSNWRRAIGPLAWQPSVLTLAAAVSLFAVAFTLMGRVSEFLYFQF